MSNYQKRRNHLSHIMLHRFLSSKDFRTITLPLTLLAQLISVISLYRTHKIAGLHRPLYFYWAILNDRAMRASGHCPLEVIDPACLSILRLNSKCTSHRYLSVYMFMLLLITHVIGCIMVSNLRPHIKPQSHRTTSVYTI